VGVYADAAGLKARPPAETRRRRVRCSGVFLALQEAVPERGAGQRRIFAIFEAYGPIQAFGRCIARAPAAINRDAF
jgi:hypothetical protein